MASGALFGNASTRSQSKNLVEFKAGKMYMKGKMVHPDKRKGQVYVYQSDDSLMHFCWKDRTSGAVEDDLIIFPDDIEFKSVPQCTTGRVYILKFKSSSRKFFFWMQEPKNDKDEEHCRKVNEYLNNPPTPGSSRGGTGAGGLAGLPPELAAGLGDSDLQNLLGNMSQQQLMQLFGGMGMGGGIPGLLAGARPTSAQSTDSAQPLRVQSSPGTRVTESRPVQESQPPRPVTAAALPSQPASSVSPLPAVTTAPSTGGTTSATVTSSPATGGAATSGTGRPASSASAAIQLSDLQSILSGMAGGEEKPRETVDLSQALNPESIIPILANPDIQKQLLNFLPEGETLPRTEEEVRNTISSPQFQQAMNTFSMALASGQLGPLMSQFNLGEEAVLAAAQGDVEAFVKAMQGVEEKKGEEKMDEEKKE